MTICLFITILGFSKCDSIVTLNTYFFQYIISVFSSLYGSMKLNVATTSCTFHYQQKSYVCEVEMKARSINHWSKHTYAPSKLSGNASLCLLWTWFLSTARQQDIYLRVTFRWEQFESESLLCTVTLGSVSYLSNSDNKVRFTLLCAFLLWTAEFCCKGFGVVCSELCTWQEGFTGLAFDEKNWFKVVPSKK